MECVENEVRRLHGQIDEMKEMFRVQHSGFQSGPGVEMAMSPVIGSLLNQSQMPLQPPVQQAEARPAKKRRSGFEVREELISDFISKGLVTLDYAVECYTT